MIKNSYGMRTVLDLPFAKTIDVVTDALKTEGFGVLTEINVQETLRKKLDVSFRRYTILGACNPPLAYHALQNELEIGLLMPCNVIVYETDEGETAVSIADPIAMLNITGAPALQKMATLANNKLMRVLERLSEF
ncbi:DUF302 domain-containing protein [Candidatus Leptofilum sp.]|uniref:DUF302 domain-containing protein n=1 Tax=Candidatus Leptofilum sp. TaxID=3241576 RepID=UPI003B5A745E